MRQMPRKVQFLPASGTAMFAHQFSTRCCRKKGGSAERAVENARRSAESAHLIEHTYITPAQLHTAFEPHCCVAQWESAEKLTVYASTQASAHLQVQIMKEYDLKKENVTVIAPYVGGSIWCEAGITYRKLRGDRTGTQSGRTRETDLYAS